MRKVESLDYGIFRDGAHMWLTCLGYGLCSNSYPGTGKQEESGFGETDRLGRDAAWHRRCDRTV